MFQKLTKLLYVFIFDDSTGHQISTCNNNNNDVLLLFLQDLYSQHYEAAGVMFASCPNFNHHYTEDAVNNNGLEWIRFLNEVLSDYDDLLNEQRFKTVVKIKTVASTYMAASGINLEKPVPEVTRLSIYISRYISIYIYLYIYI